MKKLLIFLIKVIVLVTYVQNTPSNPDSEVVQDDSESKDQGIHLNVSSTETSQDLRVGSDKTTPDLHLGSVETTADLHLSSVETTSDHHLGSVITTSDPYLVSFETTSDLHLSHVETTPNPQLGPVETTTNGDLVESISNLDLGPVNKVLNIDVGSVKTNKNLRRGPAPRYGKIRFEQDMESDSNRGRFQGYPPFKYRTPSPNRNQRRGTLINPEYQRNVTSLQDENNQQGKPNTWNEKIDTSNTHAQQAKENAAFNPVVPFKPKVEDQTIDLNIQNPTVPAKEPPSHSNFLAEIINDFGFMLEKSLMQNSNFFISPLSIFVALSMTYLGSKGNTKKQLEEALGLNTHAMHESLFHENMRNLLASLSSQNGKVLLEVANGVFISNMFNVKSQYKKSLQDCYAANLQNVNFQDSESTVRTINQWVAQSTKNMIKEFLKGSPNPMTRLLLLNAVYFKGIWKTKFPQERTYNGEFNLIDGTTAPAQLMILYKEKFPYLRDENLQYTFVKLPYDGESMSMIIALPIDLNQEPNLQMTHKMLCDIQDNMISRQLESLILPKFSFDYARGLKKPLTALGLSDLFGDADLTGIRDERDLFVSNILHKAIIEVTEEGTTAAAVTQVAIRLLSMNTDPEFNANHPFAFYIVDEKSGVILFQGKVYNPSDSSFGGRQTTSQRAQGAPRVRKNPTYISRAEYIDSLRFAVAQRFRA